MPTDGRAREREHLLLREDAAAHDDESPRSIRGFELQELVGLGTFGQVFRAFQTSVSREVAVKIINPHYANQTEFIRRFEAEAQIIARLEHPHIVPLYDYWREPEGAFLVMRYLSGGSLDQTLAAGPWPQEKAAFLLDQISRALSVAHRQGVIHRDIKPQNILLDDDENAYLSDFGIAKDLLSRGTITEQGALLGSLAYISPELAQGQKAGAASDLYSLGVVAFELLTGRHPFEEASPSALLIKHINEPLPDLREYKADLPAEVNDVIQQATAKDPAQRFSDPLAFSSALQGALSGSSIDIKYVSVDDSPLTNPYKGLRPFEEADTADFFGRVELVQQLIDHLAGRLTSKGQSPSLIREGQARFLAIVGPSGSGKSSVVKAGLLPALRTGAIPGSEGWFIVEMTPGIHPLDELEIVLLRIAAQLPADLMAQLKRDSRGLARSARLILPGDSSQLLLVVDQFEELFTGPVIGEEGIQFLKLLHGAVVESNSPVRVIITLRADFYDRPLLDPDFSRLMKARTEVVLPMSVEELNQAILEPAKHSGVEVESDLLTRLVSDVFEQPGTLPLLQYALTELFERRQGRLLTLESYLAVGGISGAIAQRAEEIYQALDLPGHELARQLFLRLVFLGEGTEDTCRRVRRSELEALVAGRSLQFTGSDQESEAPVSNISSVIESFGKARLLTFDRNPSTREPTVEVAHEALLRQWRRLRVWLDDSRDDLRQGQKLAAAAIEWLSSDRKDGYLLRGSRLDQFEHWFRDTTLALTGPEQEYLQVSLAERAKREQAEAKRQAHELTLEQRSRNRLRVLVVVFAAATIIAIGLTLFALNRQRASEESAQLALEGQATATVAQGQALQQAGTAVAERSRADEQRLLAEEEGQARTTQEALANAAAEEADEQRRIAEEERDLGRQTLSHQLAAQALFLAGVDLSQAFLLAVESHNVAETAAALDALENLVDSNKNLVDILPITVMFDISDKDGTFHPDGKTLIFHSGLGTELWDVDTLEGVSPSVFTGSLEAFEPPIYYYYSDEGEYLAAVDRERIRVYDSPFPRFNRLVASFDGPTVQSVSFSPDNQLLAMLDVEGMLSIRVIESGDQVFDFNVGASHTAYRPEIDFSPDGRLLAAGAQNHVINVWDISSSEFATPPLTGHSGDVGPIVFSTSSALLASAGGQGGVDSTVRIWDVQSGLPFGLPLTGHTGGVTSLSFSLDGSLLASGDYDGKVFVWDVSTGRPLLSPIDVGGSVGDLVFGPDGRTLASFASFFEGEGDVAARIWDLQVRTPEIRTLETNSQEKLGLAFSSEDQYLVSLDSGGNIFQLDLLGSDSTSPKYTLPDAINYRRWPSIPRGDRFEFSFDGTVLFVSSDSGAVESWTLGEGLESKFTYQGPSEPLRDLNISRDGQTIYGVDTDGTGIWLWDINNEQEPEFLSSFGAAELMAAQISPNNQLIGAWSSDFQVEIRDMHTSEVLETLPTLTSSFLDSSRVSLAFNPNSGPTIDGNQLAVGDYIGVHLITIADGRSVIQRLPGDLTNIWSIAFSPDGKLLVVAAVDGHVALWDTQKGELIGQPRIEHTSEIWDIAFSSDSQSFATAYADGDIVLWDVDVFFEEVAKEEQSPEELIQRACDIVNRNFTAEEWTRFFGEEPYRLTCPEYPGP